MLGERPAGLDGWRRLLPVESAIVLSAFYRCGLRHAFTLPRRRIPLPYQIERPLLYLVECATKVFAHNPEKHELETP